MNEIWSLRRWREGETGNSDFTVVGVLHVCRPGFTPAQIERDPPLTAREWNLEGKERHAYYRRLALAGD